MEMVYDEEEEAGPNQSVVLEAAAKQENDVEKAPPKKSPHAIPPTSTIVGKDEMEPLKRSEIWNVSFCLLAWAFAVCNVTLVVGTSNVMVLSIGGSPQSASAPLGTFFIGAFVISCGISEALFRSQGSQFTFFVGIAISMFGTVLGGVSLMSKSTGLLAMATLCFGAANGIAFFLRFAALELVPKRWAAAAVALVVSGGVIAAFAGPETSLATRGIFGPENHLEFMGVFMMTGIFSICGALCIAVITFPDEHVDEDTTSTRKTTWKHVMAFVTMYYDLLRDKSFLLPMAVATLSWGIMAMPMALLRVAMTQVGHSARDSLLVIELHFVGMYGPGFITGFLISKFGHRTVVATGLLLSVVSIVLSLLTNEDSQKAIWLISLMLLGIGWNFQFTGATVWLTKCSNTTYSKRHIQAANDSSMFFLAGIFTFSASYIFEAGGSSTQGWKVLNASVIVLLTLLSFLLLFDLQFGVKRRNKAGQNEPERLESFDESIIEEINKQLESERQPARPSSPAGASTIIQDLETFDDDANNEGMELNYGSGTDDDDADTWPPPPPPPCTSLRIIDIEDGASYHTNHDLNLIGNG